MRWLALRAWFSVFAPQASSTPTDQRAWALEALPALATHETNDPTGPAFARLQRWFAKGKTKTVYLRADDETRCTPAVMEGATMSGKLNRRVTIDDDSKSESWTNVVISRWSIDTMGGVTEHSRKGADGRWEDVSVSASGCTSHLTRYGITKANASRAVFRTYSYTLTAKCSGNSRVEQHCTTGGTRECTRCAGIWLEPHAEGMGWGRGSLGTMGFGHRMTPVDCSLPCPADQWTPKIAPLNEALKGQRFYGTVSAGMTVYRWKNTCRADAARARAKQRTDE